MQQKISYILILFSLLIFSCEEQMEWDLQVVNQDIIAVDATITNRLQKQRIHLTKSFSTLNEKPTAVSKARVRIQQGLKIFSFTEKPFGSGVYVSDTVFAGLVDKTYTLRITHDGQVYSAKTYMVPVSIVKNISWSQVTDSLYELSSLPNGFDNYFYSRTEFVIDWSFLPGYDTLPNAETHAVLNYYTLPTLDVSQEFAFQGREKVYFPLGAKIVSSKYSLTPEHAAFVRDLLFETQWSGGMFDEARANVSTNLNNGAVGYFSVSSVSRKETFVQ